MPAVPHEIRARHHDGRVARLTVLIADDLCEMDPAGYIRRFKRDVGQSKVYTLNGHSIACVDLVAAFLKYVDESGRPKRWTISAD